MINDDERNRILSLLVELRDDLLRNDTSALQTAVQALTTKFSPNVSTPVLVSFLFRDETSDAALLPRDALSALGILVNHDPGAYLKPVSRAVKDEAERLLASSEPMLVSPAFVEVIVEQLKGTDVEVAVNAEQALAAICRKLGPASATLTLSALQTAWQQSWDQLQATRTNAHASTVCLRCVSAMVEIAVAGNALMQVAEEGAMTTTWLTMLQYDADPLLQLSTLDLIEKLATIQPFHVARTQWLFSTDSLIQTVLHMAGDEGEPDPLLGGAALRVVASLCKLLHHAGRASLFTENHRLLTGFHHALHNWQGASSDVDRLSVVDAISSFASASEDALELVLQDPTTRQAWLSLAVAQAKLKAAILVSVAQVLDPPPQIDMNGDSVARSRPTDMKLYAAIGQTNDDQETTDLLLKLAKSPLPEIRLGCYAVLEAVAKLPTGGQVLFIHGDFFQFLTVRENETTKQGREAKFAIVQAILESPVTGLLADEIVRQLEKYVADGPHYQKAMSWELATEQ